VAARGIERRDVEREEPLTLEIREIAAAGYRSLRAIRFPLRRLSVFVGANGVGKTNLYRALQLIQAAAAGSLAHELAAEGGMGSALWAGKRSAKKPVRMRLMASLVPGDTAAAYAYDVKAGLATPTAAAFVTEPQIKEEALVFHHRGRKTMLERRGPAVFARGSDDARVETGLDLTASQTALGAIEDPERYPDLFMVRRAMLDWRFYHGFRTDLAAPLRQPCLAVATPTLSADASDLAAVLATLVHIREDTAVLDRAVDDAFPGSRLEVPPPERTASFGMIFPEHPERVFEAGELSDGTLRYLALMGALLAYRLPGLVALNEPETSLHPALLRPLARLIAQAAERTQVWVVTHSETLAAALAEHGGVAPMTVVKRDGETWIEGLTLAGEFREEED
jgi:predicted ATPase